MSKEQVVADAKAAIIAGQDAVLEGAIGAACDAILAEVPKDGFTQADIDAAVEAKGIADQAAIDAIVAQMAVLQADDDKKTAIIDSIKALIPA